MNYQKYAKDFERIDDLLYRAEYELLDIDGEKQRAVGMINQAVYLAIKLRIDLEEETE